MMRIQVVFNSQAAQPGLLTGWGLAVLIDGRILFDTGADSEALGHNCRQLGIDLGGVEMLVISHDHWDHTGGLAAVLAARPGITVYGCPGFGGIFKDQVQAGGGVLTECPGWQTITPGIAVTGEILATYKGKPLAEQSLVIDGPRGLTVLTGCAHPGIIRILEQVGARFPGRPLAAVLGGFHLLRDQPAQIRAVAGRFQEFGVQKVGPSHCSGESAEAIFQKFYPDRLVPMRAGDVIPL